MNRELFNEARKIAMNGMDACYEYAVDAASNRRIMEREALLRRFFDEAEGALFGSGVSRQSGELEHG